MKKILFLLLSIMAVASLQAESIVTLGYCGGEATDKGSRLWQKRWCKRHGLTMREQVTALGYGATLWWGEDADGNKYGPDADETPVCISPIQEGGAK